MSISLNDGSRAIVSDRLSEADVREWIDPENINKGLNSKNQIVFVWRIKTGPSCCHYSCNMSTGEMSL